MVLTHYNVQETTLDPIAAGTASPPAPPHFARNTLHMIPIHAITPSGFNPRKTFDAGALTELTESIRTYGVLQPILVRPLTADGGKEFEIVAGERRYHAAIAAGLTDIPAMVEDLDEAEALQLAIIENLHREGLNAMEEAEGYFNLNRLCGLKQSEIAGAVKRQQPTIANRIKLLKLPPDVQELVRAGQLSPAHGLAITRFDGFPPVMSKMAQLAIEHKHRAKDLERGVPFSWELSEAGIVATFRNSENNTKEACQKRCPHNAFRRVNDWGGAICLHPPCLYERTKNRIEAEDAETARFIAQIQAETGEKPVFIRELAHGAYERLNARGDSTDPLGCKAECPSKKLAIDLDRKPVIICVDAKCYRKLKAADTRAKNKARKANAAETIRRIQTKVGGLQAVGPQELTLLCVLATSHIRDVAGEFQRCGAGSAGFAQNVPPTLDRLDELSRIPVLQLVKATIETVLTANVEDELSNKYDASHSDQATWYLANAGTNPTNAFPEA